MLVKEFMTKDVVTCSPDQTVGEAAELMSEKGFNIMPIVDDSNKLLGIITESDFIGKEVEIPHAMVSMKKIFGKTFNLKDVEAVYAESKKTKLEKVMSTNLKTIAPDATLNSLVDLMVSSNLKRIPVVDGDKLVGIIARKDLIRAFNKA